MQIANHQKPRICQEKIRRDTVEKYSESTLRLPFSTTNWS